MTSLTDTQREKTLEVAESAEDILRRARRGMATQAEITAATNALLKQFADENATRDAVDSTVTQKDVAVRKPLKLTPHKP